MTPPGFNIPRASVIISLSAFFIAYAVVFGAGGGYILKMIRKGPQPFDDGPDHDEGERTPMRPISAADGPVGDD